MKKKIALFLSVILLLAAFFTPVLAARLLGDVSGDGEVTAEDARLVLRISVGLEPYGPGTPEFEAADYDGDGIVRASDARATLRCAVGLVPIDDPAPQEQPKELNVCLAGEPYSLDPALNSGQDGFTMLAHLFSGLAKWTQNENGAYAIVPDAAESLPAGVKNPDGTVTYTYTLRDGMTWSDGKPVTAGDFVFAWNRAAAPETEADYGYMFEIVDGYYALQEQGKANAKLNVAAVDDKTLEVTLISDVPYWNELLAFSAYFPVREDVVSNSAWATDPSTYICNGPYKMTEWKHDSVITLEKNDAYYDAAAITMPKISFYLSNEMNELLDGFLNGRLQFIDDVPAPVFAQKEYPDTFKNMGMNGTYFAVWNINEELLPAGSGLSGAAAEAAREEIRSALNRLLDRNYIVEEICRGGQLPASTFVPMGMTDADDKTEFYLNAGHNDYTGYYDVSDGTTVADRRAAAIDILKKYYRFENGEFTDFPTLNYCFNESTAHRAIAEYIRDEFAALGIRLELCGMGWNELQTAQADGGFSISRSGWLADYNDPISFLDMWVSVSGNNTAFFGKNANANLKYYDLDLTPFGYDIKVVKGTWAETYDVLISVIKRCGDKEVRYQLMHLAEDMLMATGCVCPIYYYTDYYMLSKNVRGFFSTPLGVKYFMYTDLAA